MKTLILLLALIGSTAHAQDRFSIETVNGEVCRTKRGQTTRCLPTFESLGLLSSNEIELVTSLDGGAKLTLSTGLTGQQARSLSESYRHLSIRNLATSPATIVLEDGHVRLPFFASVRWKGRGYMEGTIHFEGEIRAAQSHVKMSTSRFSDSSTEQKIHALRFLETAARHIHFRIAGTDGKSVDEATMAFLNEIVGPVILAEIGAASIPGFVTPRK